MSDDQQPVDPLRAVRPYDDATYLAPGDDPAADALLRRVTNRKPRRRRRFWLGSFVVIGLVSAGTATAYVLTRSASDPTAVTCYASDDILNTVQVGVSADPDEDPVDQCRPFWTDGPLGTNGPPELFACVNDGGAIAVVPGEPGNCSAFGWAEVATGELATGQFATGDALDSSRVGDRVGLNTALSERFAGRCLNEDEATEAIEDALAAAGLDNWTVTPLGSPTNDCVTPSPDPDFSTVRLIPLPPEP